MENGIPVIIRPATREDVPAIADITHEAFLLYAKQVGIQRAITALKEGEADVLRALEEKQVLVAEWDGQVVGSVRYENLGGGLGYLSRFGVRTALQQGGVGGLLVEGVTAGCRDLGLHAIALHTGAKVAHLVQFYYRAGYFIHSTSQDRGYIRALFIKELDHRSYGIETALAK